MKDPKGQSVSLLHGKYFAQAVNNNIFIGNQAPAGAAPALWSATTQQCGVLNPASSNVNIVPIRLTATYVSGTGIVNGLCLGYNAGAGNGVDAAGTVTAATFVTAIPSKLDGTAAKGKFMSAAITCIAPLRLMNLGLCTKLGAATDTNPGISMSYEFDGTVVIPPNYAVYIGADITGITAVYSFTLIWAEVPVSVKDLGW
jgi:hypothetical protein